jgi:hypothetical protein
VSKRVSAVRALHALQDAIEDHDNQDYVVLLERAAVLVRIVLLGPDAAAAKVAEIRREIPAS